MIHEERPLVSVVMITYNHDAFISEAIEGVLMQEVDFPVELIIADDYSPDRTPEIVMKYIKHHPKASWIKYTRHKQNKGMMSNFFWALEQAKGTYIALCEGDDYWTDPNKLQKQVDFLEANHEFIIHCANVKEIEAQGITINESFKNHKKDEFTILDLIRPDNPISTMTALFRNLFLNNKTFLKKAINLLNIYPAGDHTLWLLLTEKSKGKIKYSNEIVGCYRRHQGGVSSSLSKIDAFSGLIKFHTLSLLHFPHLPKNIIIETIAELKKRYFREEFSLNKIKGIIYYIQNYRTLRNSISIRDLFYMLRH